MPSTISLNRSIAFAQAMAQTRPILGVGQNATFPNEYGLTAADWVRQFILGPPFAWRWNRSTVTTTITSAAQDYTINLPTFGWLEKAAINIASPVFNKELEIRLVLGENSTSNEPTHIATMFDDNAGNITFRIMPLPDQQYTLKLDFQNASPLFTDPSNFWTPIPDYLEYLYTQGFLSKVYEQAGDEKFAITQQMFYRQVIAANGGLDESMVNLFLQERLDTQREIASVQGKTQNAVIGRGMRQA